MITPVCDVCGNELMEPGGLLFSPPVGDKSRKYHLCVKCFADILAIHIEGDPI